jgi:tRNA (guanine-N7-)-methyltransferase
MTQPIDPTDPRPGLHGRRKGKPLRTHQNDLVQALLPKISVDVSKKVDLATLFGHAPKELWIEIGFGGGEHLAADARNNPDVSFIGCEPFINGVAKMLATIESNHLDNVRLHAGDAFDVLRALPDGCATRINLLYPDPWPKRRQRKRRFVSEHSVREFARLLKIGGEFRFASDIDDYTGWTLARVLPQPFFSWRAEGAQDWLNPWPGFTRTRYEEKAIREGRRSSYLTFLRNAHAIS